MPTKRKLKKLSKITQSLLVEGESNHADFKRSPEGVSAEDLVAFANSPHGGNILIGVDETNDPSKPQQGTIIGCDTSDSSILQILNKAISCTPPINIEIYVENVDYKPILRTHVPSSEQKPHCTSKGVYCRRDGSRNRPLHPSELLHIFLDNEGKAFAERFEASAATITDSLSDLESTLKSSIESMASQLGWAEYQLGDTESLLASIRSIVKDVSSEAKDTSSRLRALFRQDNRDDPVRNEAKKNLLKEIIKALSEDAELLKSVKDGKEISVTLNGKMAIELDKKDLENTIADAITEIDGQKKK